VQTEPARAPNPSQPRSSTRQRPRDQRVAKVFDLEAARQARTSTRSFAQAQGLAESTLRGWEQRALDAELPEPVRRFFETPEGLQLLHRIEVAALVVVVLMGGGGVALVRTFLAWCGLDKLVACSDRHLHGRVRAMLDATGAWGDAERARLATGMPSRAIGVCVDETFHDGMLLVAQEPLSGFLLVEKRSARRDAETWDGAVREGVQGLPVTIEQATSDEAEGLLTLARKHLKAHHNSDVFHGQHELCGGIFGPLRSTLRVAAAALDAARKGVAKVLAARARWLAAPRTPGRPPDWVAKVDRACEMAGEAEAAQHRLHEHRAGLRIAIGDLGEAVSPVDLRTGAWLSPEAVRERLEGIFEEIWQRVAELGLGERTTTSITKARRLVEAWVGTVAWWTRQVEARVVAAALVPEVEALVRTVLIPAAVLDAARRRAPTAMVRRALTAVIDKVTGPLRERDAVWSRLPEATRRAASVLAVECAGLFQPSSSGVEGRNGYLSLRHHHLHALPAPWLKMLTVLHNYVIRRDDGTTAAERFFGRKPADLFEHLVAVTPLPARPRTRARSPAPHLFAAAG
jgi:hypothetical protein